MDIGSICICNLDRFCGFGFGFGQGIWNGPRTNHRIFRVLGSRAKTKFNLSLEKIYCNYVISLYFRLCCACMKENWSFRIKKKKIYVLNWTREGPRSRSHSWKYTPQIGQDCWDILYQRRFSSSAQNIAISRAQLRNLVFSHGSPVCSLNQSSGLEPSQYCVARK